MEEEKCRKAVVKQDIRTISFWALSIYVYVIFQKDLDIFLHTIDKRAANSPKRSFPRRRRHPRTTFSNVHAGNTFPSIRGAKPFTARFSRVQKRPV